MTDLRVRSDRDLVTAEQIVEKMEADLDFLKKRRTDGVNPKTRRDEINQMAETIKEIKQNIADYKSGKETKVESTYKKPGGTSKRS